MVTQDPEGKQPLLPRVGLGWFFVVVVLVAISLFIVREADSGRALASALLTTVVFLGVFACFSAIFFFIAFLFGAVEKAVGGDHPHVESPFIDGKLPEQIVPPKTADDV